MNQDPFADVRGNLQNDFGSLNGEAVQNHTRVQTKADPGGRVLIYFCDNCGANNQIYVHWQEIAFFAVGVPPQDWKLQNGRFVPNFGCPGCRYIQTPSITRDEAANWFKAGAQANAFTQPQAQHMMQQAQQAAAGLGRR